jgi:GTP:adenosylcobinamide-phosphate guanylyltransferase
MDAIILAGGLPKPEESLYPMTQGGYKSMLDVAGKPMVQWVLDAFAGCGHIERVVVVGLPSSVNLDFPRQMVRCEGEGDMLRNIILGAETVNQLGPSSRYTLLASSDIPAMKAEMLDWEIHAVEQDDFDICYNVIDRKVMEKRFPGSRRSYYHLKNMEVCGGDLNAIRTEFLQSDNPHWRKIIEARKNAFQQAALVGIDTLLMFFLRMFTPETAAAQVSKRLKLRGKVIVCPYAELGMDIDKPVQLEMLRSDLSRR